MALHKIAIVSDHAGQELKQQVIAYLKTVNVEIQKENFAPLHGQSVDYPDQSRLVAEAIAGNKVEKGIAICGTGIGMAITANKFPGVRAACVWDEYSTRMAKQHNDANLLCLGGRTVNHYRAIELVKIWLETPFDGGRHTRRLEKIRSIEKSMIQFV